MSADRIDELAGRLEAIADELADIAIEQLKGSLRQRPAPRRTAIDGDGEPADAPRDEVSDDDCGDGGLGAAPTIDERRVTRARRAVEKAVGLLRAASVGADDDVGNH